MLVKSKKDLIWHELQGSFKNADVFLFTDVTGQHNIADHCNS